MNFMCKGAVAVLMVACAISESALAGPLEDGSNAWTSGDYASAMRILRPLADRGDLKAQNRVGVMYQRGLGVPLDYADAVRWFRQAADQGDADAQNNLAFMYLYGRGVPKDYVSAHMWFSLAASGGVRSAGFSRDLLAANMTPVQVAKAQKLAREWKPVDDRRHLYQLNADSVPIGRVRTVATRSPLPSRREPIKACGGAISSSHAALQQLGRSGRWRGQSDRPGVIRLTPSTPPHRRAAQPAFDKTPRSGRRQLFLGELALWGSVCGGDTCRRSADASKAGKLPGCPKAVADLQAKRSKQI
jgi:hypothetical protein